MSNKSNMVLNELGQNIEITRGRFVDDLEPTGKC